MTTFDVALVLWLAVAGLLYGSACFPSASRSYPETPVFVDVVEFNTTPNDDRPDQLILWRWTKFQGTFGHRVAQFVVAPRDVEARSVGGRYRITFRESSGRFRILHTHTYRETKTRHDPETRDALTFSTWRRRPYF